MTKSTHMICHTHWDREWYFTREQFRVKLVRLIDGLLDLIDSTPEFVSFMLDGQAIAIRDYLEVKPYNRERLHAALASGKIVCGPWFMLPDELLVSGESHIRNFMAGGRVLEGICEQMKIAYLPDSFGHPAQMPQIVRGLGMDTMLFWRGTASFMDKTEFYWQSLCEGVSVLCVHMPSGYGNSGNLSGDMSRTVPRLVNMIDSLAAKSTTDTLLLMNGSDHITGQADIADIVARFNAADTPYKIKLSTMQAFVDELKPQLGELATYGGELRYSDRTLLLGGTLSTRTYLKQHNTRVQRDMERYIEPLQSWEYLCGARQDIRGYNNYIWDKILENQPHDSICGCSIDEVHAEGMARYATLEQLQHNIMCDTIDRLPLQSADSECTLALFEPTQDRLPSYAEVDIDLDAVLVQEVNFDKSIIEDYEDRITHPHFPRNIDISDESGRQIPHTLIKAEKAYRTKYSDNTLPEIYKVNRVRVGMWLPPFEYGVHTLNVQRVDEKGVCEGPIALYGSGGICNEFYEVAFADGAFVVTDRRTNKTYEGISKIIDMGDAGDEYTYSWPQSDKPYTLENAEISYDAVCAKHNIEPNKFTMTARGTLMLPQSLTDDRSGRSETLVPCKVAITATLYSGIDRIDFDFEIDNAACDHRLQVQFPSGILAKTSHSSGAFGITEREIERTIPENWVEYPQSTHPTHGYCRVSVGETALTLAADGINEYEAVNIEGQTYLRLTLLRCVGWLSRTDLLTREGNGGWTIATPEAQCIGKHTFRYSITYGNQGIEQTERFLHAPTLRQIWGKSVTAKVNPLAFISSLPFEIRVSACKVAEDGDGVILRLYNIGDERSLSIPLPHINSAYLTNLCEENQQQLPIKNEALSLSIKHGEIITLRLK